MALQGDRYQQMAFLKRMQIHYATDAALLAAAVLQSTTSVVKLQIPALYDNFQSC